MLGDTMYECWAKIEDKWEGGWDCGTLEEGKTLIFRRDRDWKIFYLKESEIKYYNPEYEHHEKSRDDKTAET